MNSQSLQEKFSAQKNKRNRFIKEKQILFSRVYVCGSSAFFEELHNNSLRQETLQNHPCVQHRMLFMSRLSPGMGD